MRINLKRLNPGLAAAAVVLAGATTTAVAFAALPSLASAASTAHAPVLGCSRAGVCTTAIAADTTTFATANTTAGADHAFYPIAPATVVRITAGARSAVFCVYACQHNGPIV